MSDGLSYEIEGLDKMISRLSPVEAEKALRNGMQVAVLRARRQLTTNLSGKILKRRTGATVGATSTEVQSNENEVVGIITNTARWRWKGRQGSLLQVHEDGATIKPRQGASYTLVGDRIVRGGGVLRFELGGKVIYTRKPIVIPARKPMSTSIEEVKPKVKEDIRKALFRRLNGEPALGSGE